MEERKAATAARLSEILCDGVLWSGWGSSFTRWHGLDQHLQGQCERLKAAELDLRTVNNLLMDDKVDEALTEVKISEYARPGSNYKFLFDLLFYKFT